MGNIELFRHAWLLQMITDNHRLACELELSSALQASRRSMLGKEPILVPRDHAPFSQQQESRFLGRSNFPSIRKLIVSYSQRISFVRLDSEQAQSDEKSVNRGPPMLDYARGRDSWYWPKGAFPLGTTMMRTKLKFQDMPLNWLCVCLF